MFINVPCGSLISDKLILHFFYKLVNHCISLGVVYITLEVWKQSHVRVTTSLGIQMYV